jgi:hypothetical protein
VCGSVHKRTVSFTDDPMFGPKFDERKLTLENVRMEQNLYK